jgi:hypothetical protein
VAEIDLPSPLTPGVVKGLLLRHLRYWAGKPDIFYSDGTLNIGFAYPNMFMCEDYNSPQSPYWCMKAFVMLALPADHPFWACDEEPLPLSSKDDDHLEVKLLEHPKHIVVDSGNHHFLLSSGQYCGWPLKSTEAKYCKFAYSSTFGFSVPTGPLIQQMAPDNALALSEDGGETWKPRWRSEETTISNAALKYTMGDPGVDVSSLVNVWSPSKSSRLTITTTLIPPTKRWPDWHIRVHKAVLSLEATHAVSSVEGAFAIYGQKSKDGLPLPPLNWKSSTANETLQTEGVLLDEASALIVSSAGASGIRRIALHHSAEMAKGVILKPDSNTNLMVSRSLIPIIQHELFRKTEEKVERGIIFATAVFAIAGSHLSAEEIRRRWFDSPRLRLKESEDILEGSFIQLS